MEEAHVARAALLALADRIALGKEADSRVRTAEAPLAAIDQFHCDQGISQSATVLSKLTLTGVLITFTMSPVRRSPYM